MSADDDLPLILQIIPAFGWWALYRDREPEPVQCFALVEADGCRSVLSVLTDGRLTGFAEDDASFDRIEYRSPQAITA